MGAFGSKKKPKHTVTTSTPEPEVIPTLEPLEPWAPDGYIAPLRPDGAPPPEVVEKLTLQTHALMRHRAEKIIQENRVELPNLERHLSEMTSPGGFYFGIPGMYGGFRLRFESGLAGWYIQSSSWCRVCGGSGEDHSITETGFTLEKDATDMVGGVWSF